jgi:hypothetical protein
LELSPEEVAGAGLLQRRPFYEETVINRLMDVFLEAHSQTPQQILLDVDMTGLGPQWTSEKRMKNCNAPGDSRTASRNSFLYWRVASVQKAFA